jgi:glycosyltransferase involved in cell wall biosynthesis
MNEKRKIIRTSTVPSALDCFCRGQLKMLSSYYDVIAVSSPLHELEKIHDREGVRIIPVRMERHIAILKDIQSLFSMISVFHKEKPYIVHSMTPKAGLISMLAAWVCRVPIRINTYTGLIFPTAKGLKKSILIFMDRLTCFCATEINPESEGVKNDLLRYHVTKKPLKILANGNVRGVDLAYYDRTESVMQEADKLRIKGCFTFCFVGRVVGDKGINELVAAFDKLHKEIPATVLFLIGEFEDRLDPLKESTKKRISRGEGIMYCGKQEDVRPYYAASDALAFPSYREGMPNAVIEAGAMGLPSIVTDVNGSREIIIQNENGIIIPSHDEDALYHAMRQFVLDLDSTRKMASASRKLIADRYDQKIVWKALLQEYDSLIQKSLSK